MDTWQKLAFIYAISGLPKEEKRFFLKTVTSERSLVKILIKWAKKQ